MGIRNIGLHFLMMNNSLTSSPQRQRRTWVYWRDLLRELVIRDLKVRYKNSVLGFAWSMVNPLLQLLVYYVVFSYLLPRNIPRYATFIFVGLLAFIWFQNGLFQAATAVTGNRELVRRPGFTTTVLPLIPVLTNLINFVLSLPIVLIVLWLEGASLGWGLLAVPVLILLQFIFILGLSYLVASINVIFRDTEHLLGVIIRLWFFLTPIFYDASLLPDRIQPLYRLNPMVTLVESYRAALMGETVVVWTSLIMPLLFSLVLLGISFHIFQRVRFRFIEEL